MRETFVLLNEQLEFINYCASIFGYQEEPTNTKDLIPTKNATKEKWLNQKRRSLSNRL